MPHRRDNKLLHFNKSKRIWYAAPILNWRICLDGNISLANKKWWMQYRRHFMNGPSTSLAWLYSIYSFHVIYDEKHGDSQNAECSLPICSESKFKGRYLHMRLWAEITYNEIMACLFGGAGRPKRMHQERRNMMIGAILNVSQCFIYLWWRRWNRYSIYLNIE